MPKPEVRQPPRPFSTRVDEQENTPIVRTDEENPHRGGVPSSAATAATPHRAAEQPA